VGWKPVVEKLVVEWKPVVRWKPVVVKPPLHLKLVVEKLLKLVEKLVVENLNSNRY
jgi:hypothetical protein